MKISAKKRISDADLGWSTCASGDSASEMKERERGGIKKRKRWDRVKGM